MMLPIAACLAGVLSTCIGWIKDEHGPTLFANVCKAYVWPPTGVFFWIFLVCWGQLGLVLGFWDGLKLEKSICLLSGCSAKPGPGWGRSQAVSLSPLQPRSSGQQSRLLR